jgi:hypothetical protein
MSTSLDAFDTLIRHTDDLDSDGEDKSAHIPLFLTTKCTFQCYTRRITAFTAI